MEGKYLIGRGKHRVQTRRRMHMFLHYVARLDRIRDSTTTWESEEGKYIELRQKLILIGPTHLQSVRAISAVAASSHVDSC